MKTSIVGLALLLAATSAQAQSATDWTGFYAGLSLGQSSTGDGGQSGVKSTAMGVQAGYLYDMGAFVVGGELSYSQGDYQAPWVDNDWNSTRLKLIGGYDAGRVLPYAFVGTSQYDIGGVSVFSDTVSIYGAGLRVALSGQVVAGLEYVVQDKDNYDNNFDLDNNELSLRLDYRF